MNFVVRLLLTIFGLIIGFVITLHSIPAIQLFVGAPRAMPYTVAILVIGTAVGGALGFWLIPWVLVKIGKGLSRIEQVLARTPLQDIVAGAIGLLVGLVIASLAGIALSLIPVVGGFLPTVGMVILGYLGLSVGVRKRDELFAFLAHFPRIASKDREKLGKHGAMVQPKVLDTSVIIDGRIADVLQSGFIEGTVIVPSFILEELRHIADSSDTLKRNRGRRGLDMLNKIQKQLGSRVQVLDVDLEDSEVDSRLVRLAKQIDGKIITNDFNLNKVAEFHGVPVLNINELANCLKPVVLPGEDMVVHVVRDGKETGQGIGYLDDGTMIVVDGGKRHIGETIGVSVTSVLQTAAGRMIFAKPKASVERTTG